MGLPAPSRVPTAQLVRIGVLGIAMGLLEAIVVVYLRELYFPGGFRFPLGFIPVRMLGTEMLRELSTVVLLAMAAAVAAKGFTPRLAVFLFTFGVWDICYYVFLKALLGWPPSLFTWDVLFLIPVTWVGPVLAPILCSLTMIGLSLVFVRLDAKQEGFRLDGSVLGLMAAGAVLIFLSFVWDYGGIIVRGGFIRDYATLADNREFRAAAASFVPRMFHWGVFGAGEALILLSGLFASLRAAAPRK